MTVLIILTSVVLYSLGIYLSLPYTTKHRYDILRQQHYNEDHSVRIAIEEGRMMAAIWPLSLPVIFSYPPYKRTSSYRIEHNRELFDSRVNRRKVRKSKIEKLMRENREMALQLGLSTEEYEMPPDTIPLGYPPPPPPPPRRELPRRYD